MTPSGQTIIDPSDYRTDTLWNLMAFVIQASAGAILTIGLFFYSGSEHLGIFNQLYAIFVVAGQLFVFGLNDSAQKYSAEYFKDTDESARLALMALIMGSIGALIGACLIDLGAHTIAVKFYSEQVQLGLLWLAPGIFLFVINKVLLGLLNGRQRFKRFAIVQSLRATVLVILIFTVVLADISIGYIGICFTLAELIVLFSQIDFVASIWRKGRAATQSISDYRHWGTNHFIFGTLSMPHGFLSESFIRIDILVLAFFVDDATIGIYSFAVFFVEGVYQVPVLIRNITNPRLVRLFQNKDKNGFWQQVKKSSGLSFLLTIVLCATIVGSISLLGHFVHIENLETLRHLMVIIFAGLIIYSLFIPFDYALLQGGKPAVQSLYMLAVNSLNLTANIILIPTFGLVGAAIGTAIAMGVSGIFLVALLFYSFNFNNWPNNSAQNK
jgi:O-antigen/teichoic acid export membrane protein